MDFEYKHAIPSDKDKEIQVSRASVYSTESETILTDLTSFTPSTRLQIHAQGHALIRLPLPSSELEVVITSPDGQTQYVSTRGKRCSGNAILSHSKRGDLISTSYFFGPNREPVIKLLQPLDVSLDTIQVSSRWTSRATAFTMPDGRVFEWFHNSGKNGGGEKINVLVLRLVEAGEVKQGKKERNKVKAIAKLVRSDGTRTLGTGRMTAGNGGELAFDLDAGSYLAEEVVVATCLMMLKKEVDRRRAMQFAMMAGVASGAS